MGTLAATEQNTVQKPIRKSQSEFILSGNTVFTLIFTLLITIILAIVALGFTMFNSIQTLETDLRSEMQALRSEVQAGFESVNNRIDDINNRIDDILYYLLERDGIPNSE